MASRILATLQFVSLEIISYELISYKLVKIGQVFLHKEDVGDDTPVLFFQDF